MKKFKSELNSEIQRREDARVNKTLGAIYFIGGSAFIGAIVAALFDFKIVLQF